MTNTFFIGDTVMIQSNSINNVSLTFNGAHKVDGGWEICLTQSSAMGYGGGSCVVKHIVTEQEKLRLGKNFKGYVANPLKPKKNGELKKISAIQFTKIEKDMIEVYFDLI